MRIIRGGKRFIKVDDIIFKFVNLSTPSFKQVRKDDLFQNNQWFIHMRAKAKVESDISSRWFHRDIWQQERSKTKSHFRVRCRLVYMSLKLNDFSPGLLGIIWYCLWLFIVAESPAEHSTITKEELEYIQNSIGFTDEQVKVN